MKKVIAIIVLVLMAAAFAQQTFSPSLVSFTTGQVSPRLEARTQFAKYKSACRTIENMFVRTQGPVSRRPGTAYIAEANDPDLSVRLISFEYSTDDSYVLALENGEMSFFRTVE
jgi:hypothetical protein